MPDTPESDPVKEAREFISIVADWGIYDHAKRHIASLCDEVERLRKQQKDHAQMVDDYYGSR